MLQTGGRQCGAKALLTTEKDSLNLPSNLPAQAGLESAMPLFACVIRTEVRAGDRLVEALLSHLWNLQS